MPIYLKIGPAKPDGSVDDKQMLRGDSTAVGHVQWIELNSCSLGDTRGSTPTNSTGRDSSSPKISEIACSRDVDGISPILMRWAQGTGTPISAEIDFLKEVGQQAYIEV